MKRIWMILLLCCLCFAGCGEKSSRYMKTAEEHYAKGEYEEAAYNYIRAIEEDKDNEEAYYGAIDSYIMTEEYDKAEKYLNKAANRFDSKEVDALQEELKSLMKEKEEKTVTPEPTATPEPTPTPIPEPTASPKLSSTQIYETCVDSIVWVQTGVARGSGFFIEEDVVVTNYHVVEGATKLYIIMENGDEADVLEVLGYAPELDIAVLRVDYSAEPLPLNSHGITVGEKTYAIGNPLDYSFSFSDGIVTNKEWMHGEAKAFLTNTPISSGNSGGPLLNEYGEVMGLTTAIRKDAQNINFVVNIDQLALVDMNQPMTATEFVRLESGGDDSAYVYEDSNKSNGPGTAQVLAEELIYLGTVDKNEYLDYYKLEIKESGTYAFVYCSDDVKRVGFSIADSEAKDILYNFEQETDGETASDYIYMDAGTYYFVAREMYEITGASVEYAFLYMKSEEAYEIERRSADTDTAQTVWLSQTLYGTIAEGSEDDYYVMEIPADGIYGVYVSMDDPSKTTMGIYDWDRQKWAYFFTPESETGLCSGEMELLAGTYYINAYLTEGESLSEAVGYAYLIFPAEEGSMDGEIGAEQSKDVFGSVKDGVYSNEYYGIHFTMDSSWEYKTAEDLQTVPEDKINLPYGEEYSVFYAEKKDGTAQLELVVERMTEDEMQEFKTLGEDGIAEYIASEFERGLAETSFEGITSYFVEKKEMAFCGEDKQAVKVTMESVAGDVFEYQVFYVDTEYVAYLTLMFYGEITEKEMFSLFY